MFRAIPDYWHQAADWLTEHNTGKPVPGRVLVVPGRRSPPRCGVTATMNHCRSSAKPLGVRDSIPLTPPQTIRALDSVQRLLAAGRPSPGLADTLARQGISYVVVRNDLDPDIPLRPAVAGAPGGRRFPGLERVAQFGDPVGPGTLDGFISDSGLRPRYPAVEIYRVAPAGPVADNPGAPYLSAVADLTRVDGGPESLLRLDERRRMLRQPPLARCCWPPTRSARA